MDVVEKSRVDVILTWDLNIDKGQLAECSDGNIKQPNPKVIPSKVTHLGLAGFLITQDHSGFELLYFV